GVTGHRQLRQLARQKMFTVVGHPGKCGDDRGGGDRDDGRRQGGIGRHRNLITSATCKRRLELRSGMGPVYCDSSRARSAVFWLQRHVVAAVPPTWTPPTPAPLIVSITTRRSLAPWCALAPCP